ncbi:fungal-specific transcription factor domain-containing protein [Penicillium verhagenii]|uniref:fungal-specific transcription factor domain-containing protein n=1 Tax=Penicillium verhagenii TaxID=1562060 RepID=UPI0025459026|nr:fungal-specific transcription factor domain-containing protein [Penicillium verhagenii]KAJ5934276.1 fungal-specific transcription factor domain-containing protein [Penicillium verhagenii]
MRPCNYQAADKRKISWKSVVDLLTSRVDELVRFIIDQGLAPPSMIDDNEQALKNALDALGLDHIQKALEGAGTKQKSASLSTKNDESEPLVLHEEVVDNDLEIGELESDINLLMDPFMILENQTQYNAHCEVVPSLNHPSDDLFEPFRDSDAVVLGVGKNKNHDYPPQPHLDAAPASQNHFNKKESPATDIYDNDGTEDIVDRLSDRMGSLQIGTDGQIRYYGPTSHFNLLRMPTPDNLTIHRTIRKDGQDHLRRMGLDKEVPQSMEEHLINQYFTWHSPSVDVVNREMYETAKQQWQDHMEETTYYSEALTNAICCLGAAFEPRYHPNFVTYPRSVSDFFADRAKTLLDIELDSPTVATVQAMVVLSGHDIGCKRDARGWLYSGMAMRLAFDLGLHIDMSSYVANGSISEAEAEVRRMVFWGAYTLDHHWGYFLGRPFRMNLEDVTVQKPGLESKPNHVQRWYPYGLPHPTKFPPGLSIANFSSSLSLYRIALCEIMTPLGHVLYGSSKISKEALQKLNAETTDRLLHWKANLPKILLIDTDEYASPPLPHVLMLHLYYHQAIIHAHRPWMSKSSIQPLPQQGAGHAHARKMCVESGTAIAKLLHLYEQFYTFRRMNIQVVAITCSAALMLIFAKALHRTTQDDEATVADLNVCFRALEDSSSAWESAKRAQSFLLHMQGLWDIQIRPYRAGKRVGPQGDFLRPKRSRTSAMPLPSLGSGSGRDGGVEGGDGDVERVESESEELEWLWAATMGAVPASQSMNIA